MKRSSTIRVEVLAVVLQSGPQIIDLDVPRS